MITFDRGDAPAGHCRATILSLTRGRCAAVSVVMVSSHALALALSLAAELPAPVTGAVIHGDSARVTRTAEVTIDGGERFTLPLLARETDPDSVRVEASGAEIVAVDVTRLDRRHVPEEAARALIASLQKLDDDLALLDAEKTAIESALASANQSPEAPEDEEIPWASLDPARWRQTLAFLRSFGQRLDERRAAVASGIAALKERRAALAAEALQLTSGDDGKVRVVVRLSGHGRARVRTSYLVSGPTWTPRYDVRLDPTRDEVTVSLAALASQETGEDWVSARLAFSTAIPQANPAVPELPRWVIGEAERFIPRTVAREAPAEAAAPAATPAVDPESIRARLMRLAFGSTTEDAFDATPRPAAPAPSPRPSAPPSPPPPPLQPPTIQTSAGGAGILGFVYDQTGQPIRGVKVTAASPTLVGGRKTAYSNDEGAYRLPGLPPGIYEVRATAPRLKTVVQVGVRVGVQASAEITLVMEVQSAVEEVKVIETAPTIATSSASVRESYDQSFVDTSVAFRSPGAPEPRRSISLAPPPGHRRPRLAPGMPAALAGGHDLTFDAAAAEYLFSGAAARPVSLGSWRWPVTVVRRLIPAVRAEAYLVAAIRSPATTVLPAGEAWLALDGKPVGRAQLALLRPGQPFTLPLGMDRAVRAVRQVQLDSSEVGLISKDDVNRYTVTIDVANPHPRAITAEVVDQIPRARDDSVRVGLEGSTPTAVLEEKTGTLTWKLALPAGATAQVRFIYSLKRPQGNRLHQ